MSCCQTRIDVELMIYMGSQMKTPEIDYVQIIVSTVVFLLILLKTSLVKTVTIISMSKTSVYSTSCPLPPDIMKQMLFQKAE